MECSIGGKIVSNNGPVLIIAEAGINHDGKLSQAFDLIDMAADAGADVVKFQLFTARKMYPRSAGVFKTAKGEDVDIYKLIEDVELPESWIPELIKKCNERGVGFLCTTCDEESTDILSKYDVDAYKIASSEITHLPLLQYTAQMNKTMIVSEGASTLKEVAEAVETIQSTGNNQIVLMHCTAEYPATLADCNVSLIETYKRLFPNIIIGFSDHTMPVSDAPVQAVRYGAKVIEKHITLDKNLPGADHCYALEPHELKQLVLDIRNAEKNISLIEECPLIAGKNYKIVEEGELYENKFIHRGIFAIENIKKGEFFTKDNIAVLRPGNSENGLSPKLYNVLLENMVRANRDIADSTPIKWKDILNVEQE